jgi:hypothetical protein
LSYDSDSDSGDEFHDALDKEPEPKRVSSPYERMAAISPDLNESMEATEAPDLNASIVADESDPSSDLQNLLNEGHGLLRRANDENKPEYRAQAKELFGDVMEQAPVSSEVWTLAQVQFDTIDAEDLNEAEKRLRAIEDDRKKRAVTKQERASLKTVQEIQSADTRRKSLDELTPSDFGLHEKRWSMKKGGFNLPSWTHPLSREPGGAGEEPIGSIKVGLEVYKTETDSDQRTPGSITKVPLGIRAGPVTVMWYNADDSETQQSVTINELQHDDIPRAQTYILRSNELLCEVDSHIDVGGGGKWLYHDGVWLVAEASPDHRPRLGVIQKIRDPDQVYGPCLDTEAQMDGCPDILLGSIFEMKWYRLTEEGEKIILSNETDIYFPESVDYKEDEGKLIYKDEGINGKKMWEDQPFVEYLCPRVLKRNSIYNDKRYKPAFNRYVSLDMRKGPIRALKHALTEDYIKRKFTGHRPQLIWPSS